MATLIISILGALGLIVLGFRAHGEFKRDRLITRGPLARTTVQPVAPDPTISCFVRGVALSMTEHSVQWRKGISDTAYRFYHHGDVTVLWQWREVPGTRGCEMTHTWSIPTPRTELTEAEQALLNHAGTDLVCAQSMAEHKAKRARDAALRAPFEALGCPSQPPRPITQTVSLPLCP